MKYAFDLDDTLSDTASVINEYAVKFDKEFLKGNGKMKKINNAVDYYYFAEALNWNKDNIRDFKLLILEKETHFSYMINCKWYDKLKEFLNT